MMTSTIRRIQRFLLLYVTGTLVLSCRGPADRSAKASLTSDSAPIVDVQLGAPTYMNYEGDSWDPTWAEDDNLYAAVNDGAAFGTLKRNIGYTKITGNDPLALTGQMQSLMDYGAMNAPTAIDGRNWKSGGSISIDGVQYMSIGMDQYVDPAYGGRQTRIHASIIKSTDHGVHWTPPIAENLKQPMFPGMRFSTPFFIHYGKAYAAATVDNADKYVYANANNGFWDNGDNFILGRVLRSKIGALKAADWAFYSGGDGMQDSSWVSDMNKAALIIDASGKCGEAGMTYLPALNRYVLVTWYYPIGNGHSGKIEETELVFYESPKPWGPWKSFKNVRANPQGWYIPKVLSKFQTQVGRDLQAYIAVAGDWRNPTYYKFTMVPAKFVTGPPRAKE